MPLCQAIQQAEYDTKVLVFTVGSLGGVHHRVVPGLQLLGYGRALFPSKLAIKGFFECPGHVTFLFKLFLWPFYFFFVNPDAPYAAPIKKRPYYVPFFFFGMFYRPKRPKKTCRRDTYQRVIA